MFDIQKAIKDIANSEAAKAPRDPKLTDACAGTRGTLTILSFTGRETQQAGYGIFPLFRLDSVKQAKENVLLPPIGIRLSQPLFIENDKWGYAKKETKAIVLAALGVSAKDVPPGDIEETVAAAMKSDQPLRGMRIGYETYEKSGKHYVSYVALADSERDAAAIAARRTELDKDFPLAK